MTDLTQGPCFALQPRDVFLCLCVPKPQDLRDELPFKVNVFDQEHLAHRAHADLAERAIASSAERIIGRDGGHHRGSRQYRDCAADSW